MSGLLFLIPALYISGEERGGEKRSRFCKAFANSATTKSIGRPVSYFPGQSALLAFIEQRFRCCKGRRRRRRRSWSVGLVWWVQRPSDRRGGEAYFSFFGWIMSDDDDA